MSDFQHFVPRFYLKGFLDSESVGKDRMMPYLWVADVVEKTISNKAPKNIAGFTNYYDVHTKPFEDDPKALDNLLTVFESRAAPIIRKIRSGKYQMTVEDRYHLATFMGIQLGRVPIMRQHIDANVDQIPIYWLEKFLGDTRKLKQKHGKELDWFEEYALSGKIKARINFEDEAHRKDYINSLSINLGIEFAQVIFGMRWLFLMAAGNSLFFASDNPVRLMSPTAEPLEIRVGELNEELEISFPVSANCMLWGHSRDIKENPDIGFNEVLEIDDEMIDEFNRRILPTIDKLAFCPTEKLAEWVLAHI